MNRILSLLAALSLIAGLSFLSTTAQAGPGAKKAERKARPAAAMALKAAPSKALQLKAAPMNQKPRGLQLQAVGGSTEAVCTSGVMDWMCNDDGHFVGAGQGCDVIGDYCQPVVQDGPFCTCG